MNIYVSDLIKDLTSGSHDCTFCAMTYIEKSGGPSIIGSPNNFENLVQLRQEMLDWLQNQQSVEELIAGYTEFKECWSPVFLS